MYVLASLLAFTAPQQCPVPLATPPGFNRGPGTPTGFGGKVAIDGNLAVFTDQRTCFTTGCPQGAAFLYRYETITGEWNYEGALHRSDQGNLDVTGFSVELDSSTLAVGSPGDYAPSAVRTGSVTLWENSSAGWTEGPTLFPSNEIVDARFGDAMDLKGDMLVVSNASYYWDQRGSVNVFRRDASGAWSESAVIRPRIPASAMGFGYDVAIAGDQILVTTIVGAGFQSLPVGAIIVFEEDPQTGEWLGVQRLIGSSAHALFGRRLSVDGDQLAVASSATLGGFMGNPARGAAFVFERDPVTQRWAETQRLESGTIQPLDQFGAHVALDGQRLYVGGKNGHELYFFHQPQPGGPWERAPYRSYQGVSATGGSGGVGQFFVAGGGHVLACGYQNVNEGYRSWVLGGAPLVDCDGDGFDDDCSLALGWQLDEDSDGQVDTCGDLGFRICLGRENSVDRPTRLVTLGSKRVADANFHVQAMGMRQLYSGYLLVSNSTGFVPLAGGSKGDLCIAGPSVGRFSSMVVMASQQGTATMQVDLTALPQPTGTVTVMPGDTWYFQFWHRDQQLGGGTTSTFSDAIGVTFE